MSEHGSDRTSDSNATANVNNRTAERENLRQIIKLWNANRLDIFELTEPNEDLEFHGVMRYFFQEEGQKTATKCIRVSSTATTQDVISILIEKFRADIRMLSIPEYALYVTHESGDERKLAGDEKPLLVQLNWHKDDREGRFLLRRMDEKTNMPDFHKKGVAQPEGFSFKRKLSRREKKEKKKLDKERAKAGGKDNSISEKLYTEIPESRFTRSISNPEAVLRRRRHQLLEKKLQELVKVGGIKAGGTLRIFGETLDKDVAYKTLLLSTENTAVYVVEEILEKYNRDKSEAPQYCLVQLIVPCGITDINAAHDLNGGSGIREYILDDDDCPLAIEKNHVPARGALSFHIKRRPADYVPRKRKKKPSQIQSEQLQQQLTQLQHDPSFGRFEDVSDSNKQQQLGTSMSYLQEMNQPDGSETNTNSFSNSSPMPSEHSMLPVSVDRLSETSNPQATMSTNVTAAGVAPSEMAETDTSSLHHQGASEIIGQNGGPGYPQKPQKNSSAVHFPDSMRPGGQEKQVIYANTVYRSSISDMDARYSMSEMKGHQTPVGMNQEAIPEMITQTGSVPTPDLTKQGPHNNNGTDPFPSNQHINQRNYGNVRHLSERESSSRMAHEQQQQQQQGPGGPLTPVNSGYPPAMMSERDIMREAKMEEMREEVRRRDERAAMMLPPQQPGQPSVQYVRRHSYVKPPYAGQPGVNPNGWRSCGSLQQQQQQQQVPEIQVIHLQKSNNGMGLSILATKGLGQDKMGIYIKTVVKGRAADIDGRLQAGDQLLSVNGHSLIDISQEMAAHLMTQTGPVVTLEVAKQAAAFHGLDALMSQPSPSNPRPVVSRPRSAVIPDGSRGPEGNLEEIHEDQQRMLQQQQQQQLQQQLNPMSQYPQQLQQQLPLQQQPMHMHLLQQQQQMQHLQQQSPMQQQQMVMRHSYATRPPYPGSSNPQQWRTNGYHNPPPMGYQSHTIGPIRMGPTPAQRSVPNMMPPPNQPDPVPAVSYRYGPSGYPPKASEVPKSQSTLPTGSMSTSALLTNGGGGGSLNERNPSPWEREEEKEKRVRQRELEMRRMKEEAIRHLQELSHRTPRQEELLHKLVFDLDYRRRAEEEIDDPDEGASERVGNRLPGMRGDTAMLLNQQQMQQQHQQQQPPHQSHNGNGWDNSHGQGPVPRSVQPQLRPNVDEWAKRSQHNYNPANLNSQIEEQEERLKRLRFEEIKRQQELQQAQHAEEQILRVAKSRQEEEVVREIKPHHFPAKLDLIAHTHEADVPPPLPKSPPPFDGTNPLQTQLQQPPPLRLDRLAMNGIGGDGGHDAMKYPSSALRNGDPGAGGSVAAPVQKKVSWNDNPESGSSSPGSTGNGSGVFTLQDIDEVLGTPGEPEEAMNFAITNTPNVIGAQEVYRDPRDRIKQEKLKTQQKPNVQGPEKLSFKEKMKMFAMEAAANGEGSKDKVKNSKAQREIDDKSEDKSQEQQHLAQLDESS